MEKLISELYGAYRMFVSFRNCVPEDDLDLYVLLEKRLLDLIEKADVQAARDKRRMRQYIDTVG